MIKRAVRCGNETECSSVGDTDASMSLEVAGIYDDPEKTASMTSSVAIPRSNAEALLLLFFNGFEDSRTVFSFFNFLEEKKVYL